MILSVNCLRKARNKQFRSEKNVSNAAFLFDLHKFKGSLKQ